MTTLRKKILHSKIQNILAQNNVVLFLQFNNIKFKDWVLLKNQILNLQHTNMLVIKNNITCQMLESHISASKLYSNKKYKKKNHSLITENDKLILTNDKKQLCFLCQGPTLLLAFNSLQQCQTIYEILNIFTYNLRYTKCQLELKKNIFNLHQHKISCLKNQKLPSIFTNNKLTLNTQKYSLSKQNNEKYNLFFIGGLIQGKIINHLDFEKLSNLNNSVYVNLITQCSSKVMWFSLLNIILKIKLIKCFKTNLINLLHVHKNNMKKKNLVFLY